MTDELRRAIEQLKAAGENMADRLASLDRCMVMAPDGDDVDDGEPANDDGTPRRMRRAPRSPRVGTSINGPGILGPFACSVNPLMHGPTAIYVGADEWEAAIEALEWALRDSTWAP